MKIIKSLKNILKESYRWRNRELIENENFVEPELTKPKFLKSNIMLFLLSFCIAILPINIITKDFSGYIINALAIFFGLLTSILILIFEKFLNQKAKFLEIVNPNTNQILNNKKIQNFSRQFIFISLESLLIAIFLIILLLFPLSLENYFEKATLINYKLVIKNIRIINIMCCIKFMSLILIKTLLFLFLIKFLKYLTYIVGSLGNFILGTFRNHLKL